MNRRLIYVVGPSGAGKDSVLDWLRRHLRAEAPVHWAQRTITRPADAGSELHESVDHAGFDHLSGESAFAMAWAANGLRYGIRRTEIAPIGRGIWVFVNGSRAHLAQALRSYPGLTVVHITASSETIHRRLVARGRESAAEVQARLARAPGFALPAGAIEVSNDAGLDDAGRALLRALEAHDGGATRAFDLAVPGTLSFGS